MAKLLLMWLWLGKSCGRSQMKLEKECLKNKQVYQLLVHACSVSNADTQLVLYQ